MTDRRYDLVVIGSGPGGYVSAIRASQLGLKAAIVERDRIGGRCLNYACIPAKAVLRSAELFDEVSGASRFGVDTADTSINWNGVGKHRNKVVKTLTGGVTALLKKYGIDVIEGSGSLAEGGDVLVASESEGQETVKAERVVLATGSVATSIPGVEFGGRIIDTAGTWLIEELPSSLAVVGAGPSGVEIASAFGRFGTRVTLVEMLDQVLPAEDPEISEIVNRELSKQNVDIRTGTALEAVEQTDGSVGLKFAGDEIHVDYLCIATGRVADTDGLGLDRTGVEIGESGLIKTDGQMQTSTDGIYAIGDLVKGVALAHKASDEGVIAAEHAAGLDPQPLDYEKIPRATFCKPQVASFGLTEDQARERCDDVSIGRFPFGSIGAATVYGERTGLVKIVGDSELKEMLGAHIVGPRATELIAELVVADALEGGYEDVARIVHAHPTLSEGVMEAARDVDGWAIHN